MKVRDSCMPEVSYWESLFDIDLILKEMQVNDSISNLMEVGSGYGTFTIPAAKLISGNLFACDIENEMISFLQHRVAAEKAENIFIHKKDILEDDFADTINFMNYVMLFNIMHHENPKAFLDKAYEMLATGGKVGIIHWRSDIETPRGPDVSIRPTAEDILALVDANQFEVNCADILFPPYHYGVILNKR